MRGLLKYAFVLAVGVAIGAYIVLDVITPDPAEQGGIAASSGPAPPATPAAIEEEELEYSVAKRLASVDGWRAFLAAHPNGAHAQFARAQIARETSATTALADGSPATPALALSDNEHGYALSERLGSLAAHAQSATAKVERLLLTGKVSASDDAEASGVASSTTGARSESTPGQAVPTRGAAAGAEVAALGKDESCRRDEERLAQLRMNPSRGAAERFASQLTCEALRPQVLALFEGSAPPLASAKTPGAASPPSRAETPGAAPPLSPAETPGAASAGAQDENETAHSAAPLASADVASLSDAICERDEDRLVRLRLSPSGDEALSFEKELGCEKLRPQLQRLMESLDLGAPAPLAHANSSHANALLGQACASERSELDRLRQEPSAQAAGRFWRDMQCEGLRPQVRLLLESLNVAPDSVGSAAASREPKPRPAIADPSAASGVDSPACRRETVELNRVRAAPDLGDAERFASAVTCNALRPQVARLLESLGE